MGAGEADLKLGSIDLRKVDFQVGAGEVKVDLRGTPKHDYEVNLKGGVGECRVIVPAQVGVQAVASGGLGNVDIRGSTRKTVVGKIPLFRVPAPKFASAFKVALALSKFLPSDCRFPLFPLVGGAEGESIP